MKRVLGIVAISLAIAFAGCSKKEEASTGAGASITWGGAHATENFTLTSVNGTLSNVSNSVVTIDVPAGMLAVGNPARIVGPVDSLECPFGIVTPYAGGLDVRRRPEWDTVAVLPRPVTRPPKPSR